jgi:hypothetical protein
MLFRKLFQVLVVGGAAMGLSSGCSTPAQAQQQGRDARTDMTDNKDAPDAGMANAQDSDAGTPSGGGVLGW